MEEEMRKDLIYLVWNDVNTGNKYKVAKLYKEDGMYYFKYILENVKRAQKSGFTLLICFPKIDEVYYSSRLFAVFATRLPDKKRPDIKRILANYGMLEYDEFELLRKSGTKLPTDNYEFVE